MKATLITGASSGIGEEFARQLAAQGNNLVLVARSEDKLKALCDELKEKNKIEAEYVAIDLVEADADKKLFDETTRRGIDVDLLINNAGFGSMGYFDELDLDWELKMVALNVSSLVALTHRYLQPMVERKSGAIMNVASTAGFQPVPFMATYSATKAFVLTFSEALWEEYRPFGIKVMAFCPGGTQTNFFDAAKMERPIMRTVQTPEEAVKVALKGLKKGRSHIISGWMNYITTESQRLVPRSVSARVVGKALRGRFKKKVV
jgi:short-subunit dehydrogenase